VHPARRVTDPVIAGVLLGVVLFATIVITGQGLGASGAFATTAAATVKAVAPAHAATQGYIAERVPEGPAGILGDWLVVELLAAAVGAWFSADTGRARLTRAVAGGALMGVGARLAHGCTSGLGLTGGAMLATGAWLFIPVAFGSAFATAFVMRRLAETRSPR
jgi:uncharacterized membrane protein YedE/YeeE